ncbi:MAG: hypothetical protein ACLUEK_07795 [Oscillospiraceae bacterium]
MDADGLALVKFAQNEQDMRHIFQSNPLISEASFYFENDWYMRSGRSSTTPTD